MDKQTVNQTRLRVLFPSITVMVLLGIVFSWSVFVAPLEEALDLSRDNSSLVYALSISFYCLGGMPGGMIAKRFGFSWGLGFCALMFAGGFAVFASFPSLFTLCLGYGVLGGAGVGLGYNLVLNCISKWYPSGYGKISGLLLMCFAGGSFVLSLACDAMIRLTGWRNTFYMLSILFAVVIGSCACFIKAPAYSANDTNGVTAQTDTLSRTPLQMLGTLTFYLIFIWFTLFSIAGTTLIGNAAPLALELGVPDLYTAFVPGLVALCNGLGRIIYGSMLDKTEAAKIQIVLSVEMIAGVLCLLICVLTEKMAFLFVGCALFGNSFGGSAIYCPNIIIKEFGKKYYANNLPLLNMHVIVASLAGPVSIGKLYEKSGSYTPALWLFLLASSISLLVACIYRHSKVRKSKT